MIKFESIGDLGATSSDDHQELIGQQIGTLNDGIQPTYGMTAEDMDVENIVITFTWSD